MPCEPYRDMLIDHIADELTEEERILLEQHLAECTDCAAEEHRLRRTVEATTPGEIGEVRPATETHLLAAFRERAAALAPGHGKQASASGRQRTGNLWQRITRSGFALHILRRPVPSYAAVLLLIAAITTGFWMGRSNRTDSLPRGSHEPVRPAIRQLVPDTDALEDALAVVRIPGDDSLDQASGSLWGERSAVRFATTPSDAIGLERLTLRDTL